MKAIIDFKNKGYYFNHMVESKIITTAHELDMSYDSYIRHNMHPVEWKLIAMINDNERLTNQINRN